MTTARSLMEASGQFQEGDYIGGEVADMAVLSGDPGEFQVSLK